MAAKAASFTSRRRKQLREVNTKRLTGAGLRLLADVTGQMLATKQAAQKPMMRCEAVMQKSGATESENSLQLGTMQRSSEHHRFYEEPYMHQSKNADS